MPEGRIYRIFKRGSRTYFYNSLFFPKDVREDVFVLYSFVRQADNLVDEVPQDPRKLAAFMEGFRMVCRGERPGDVVLDSFCKLIVRKRFENEWVQAFLRSMELDLTKHTYETMRELDEYIYGSAEVIGLMMARIMGVDDRFQPHARALGKAMQLINFIRDIDEDNGLGRRYIPTEDLDTHGLKDLTFDHVRSRKKAFSDLIHQQVMRYRKSQHYAEKGYGALDRDHRIPIMNASDMYEWTARRIDSDPMIVYERKVKPSMARIVMNVMGKKLRVRA
jgi:phytoene synthase